MNSELNIRSGRKVFFWSFLIGTIIFLANIFANNGILFIVGFVFLIVVILLNVGILITIILNAITDKLNRKDLLKTGGLIIVNIPVALIYIAISLALMDMMIITLVNNNTTSITNIRMEGCENLEIKNLEPKENHTVWIDVSRDCQLNILYDMNNERKIENVIGYVSPGMGKRTTYEIGNHIIE